MPEIAVSIIVPILNGGRWLPETLATVIGQTHKNWELVLADDGSTDGSAELAREYAKRDPERIRYFEHADGKNHGQLATRIEAARVARSSLIALLDQDDLWDAEYLEQHLEIWQRLAPHNIGLSYGPCLYWYPDPGVPGKEYIQPMPSRTPRVYAPGEILACFFDNHFAATPLSGCTLIRREALEGASRFENAAVGSQCEDQFLWWHVAARWPVAQHTQAWVRYRQHRRSASMRALASPQGLRKAEILFFRLIEHDLSEACPHDPLIANGWIQSRLRALEAAQTESGAKQRIREVLDGYLSPRAVLRLRSAYHMARRVWARFLCMPGMRHLYCLTFRRMEPLRGGAVFGTTLMRYYWARFLEQQSSDIRGRALEIGTSATIKKYGGEAITQAEAVDVTQHSPEVTVVADLSRDNSIPDNTYDCFVNQFSMHVIHDVEAALWNSIRILKPNGVLLANFCCVEHDIPGGLEMGTGIPLYLQWTFTPMQVHNMLRRAGLGPDDYALSLHGNLFSRIAYQLNVPAEYLTARELHHVDPRHPLLICVRVSKPAAWKVERPPYREQLWIPAGPGEGGESRSSGQRSETPAR